MELAGAELHRGDSTARQQASLRVRLARTVSGDDDEEAGPEPAGTLASALGSNNGASNWKRAQKIIYAKRLARTATATLQLQRAAAQRRSGAASGASLGRATTTASRATAMASSWNRHISFPSFALAFWPSFERGLEWEYFFYSIAASRGSIARVCAALAVQVFAQIKYLN